ncbi:MAG: DNA primase [Acidobacteriota bacterium]|nr:DNA primase [Acidobacteriota bacterium]
MSEPVYDITDDVKRDVLAATDLVQLIGATTSLKKAGRSWKGLCPFHGEKSASFHVHPDKGFYYCFGCGAKGDAITFVREIERLEFPDAVAYLARLAGITLPMRRSGTRVDRGKETRAAEALSLAAAFFRANLDGHPAARALLEKRGLTPEEGHAYGFGAALDAWDALKSALAPRVQEEALVEAGLLQKNPETGRVYDRFRNRLTIEIRDGRGEILGFGARAFGDDQPKYLNSPETARFSKGKLLYGLDRAKEAIRREDIVLLVEGYFDRIACERAGAANAVASMGTALTSSQIDLLARQAATVVVAYDGDAPGVAAAYKAFPLLLARGAHVRHLALPEGHDPDSFLAAHGPEALRAAIAGAPPLLETLLARIPVAGDEDPTERAARLREAADILTAAPDPVLRHELLSGLARGAGVPLSVLAPPTGKKTALTAVKPMSEASAPRHSIDLPEQEARVLAALLSEWPESARLAMRIPEDIFFHPVAKELLMAIKELPVGTGTLDFSQLTSHLGADAGPLAAELLLRQGNMGAENPGESGAKTGDKSGLSRIHIPLLQLKIRSLEETARGLQPEIQDAAAAGNLAGRDAAYRRKQSLVEEVRKLKAELKAETARRI